MDPIAFAGTRLVEGYGRCRSALSRLWGARPSVARRLRRGTAGWVGAAALALIMLLTTGGRGVQTVHPTTPGSSAFTLPGDRTSPASLVQTAAPRPYRQVIRLPERHDVAVAPGLAARKAPDEGAKAVQEARSAAQASSPAGAPHGEASQPAEKAASEPSQPQSATSPEPSEAPAAAPTAPSPSHQASPAATSPHAPDEAPAPSPSQAYPSSIPSPVPEPRPDSAKSAKSTAKDEQSTRPQDSPLLPSKTAPRVSWSSPVPGAMISNPFGKPDAGYAAGYHTGTDFAVPVGTTVRAVGDATVVSAGVAGAYGQQIVLRLGDGHFALYAHLSKISVAPGQRVSAGDSIGRSGNTGNSTGPHLHFEIRTANVYGAVINPVAYLAAHGVDGL